MATYVLVHGASVGAWAWKYVTPHLWHAGHIVYAPTLTGLGHRAHLASPENDLQTHIQDVVNLLEFEDLQDVILVGWSYGGMPITGAADRIPGRISRLVYLDADVPRDREISSTSTERMAARERDARESGEGWRAMALPPELLVAHLREHVPDELAIWIVDRMIPHPLNTWAQPITPSNPALFKIQHTFVRCMRGIDLDDPDVLRTNHRMQTEEEWDYREIDAEHFAPLTAPKLVAETLIDIAARLLDGR